ncbi:MAG TPA: nucleotide exchange factor GrpE [Candidatus Wallbacteria bacterium]|nr:nucleotide exchange factor GrpE [Candidatus Wallbacteria bacterium]
MENEVKFENFEKLITQENVSARMDSAIEKIKSYYTSDEALKAVEEKVNAMDVDDAKKTELKNKTDMFLKAMTKGFNRDAFRNQIIATINDEQKIKDITEEELLKVIGAIENEMSSKNDEFLVNSIRMIFEMDRRNAEDAATSDKTPAQIEIEKQKALAAEYLNALQRMKADFDNYKKRVLRDKEEQKTLALESLFTELLSVLDSFDAIKPDSKIDYEGVQKIGKQFRTVLEKYALKEIESMSIFDANLHQAIASDERDDLEEHTITEVFRKGYMLGEKLVRPAMVKVSVRSANEVKEDAASPSN